MAVIGLNKHTYYSNLDKSPSSLRDKYGSIEKSVRKILEKNPSYGYRRLQKVLRREDTIINHKALKSLLRTAKINLKRKSRRRRRSGIEAFLDDLGDKANLVKRLTERELFQVVFSDFTRLVYAKGKRTVWLVVYLEAVSKKVIGYKLGRAITKNALAAYQKARTFLKKKEVNLKKTYIHQDQGVQYTAYDYVGQLCSKDGVNISFSRKGHFEDNPEMESFNGRLKNEWKDEFFEANTDIELRKLVAKAILYYNKNRIHSALGDCSPDEFIKIHQKRKAKNHS